MNLIAAVDSGWGIGKDNELLFHIPQDMKFFKEKTTGKILIMGRKTLESLPGGKPLKERKTVILSGSKKNIENCETYSSVDELIEGISRFDTKDIFVGGGQSVYEQLLPFCDTAYITKIEKELPADKFFPNLDENKEWKLQYQSEAYEHKGIKFTFCTYVRNL